ncbi:MAG: hypothetical protein ACLT16_09670 [[Clostridium] innocuum]
MDPWKKNLFQIEAGTAFRDIYRLLRITMQQNSIQQEKKRCLWSSKDSL